MSHDAQDDRDHRPVGIAVFLIAGVVVALRLRSGRPGRTVSRTGSVGAGP